jgi:hypothetical protein
MPKHRRSGVQEYLRLLGVSAVPEEPDCRMALQQKGRGRSMPRKAATLSTATNTSWLPGLISNHAINAALNNTYSRTLQRRLQKPAPLLVFMTLLLTEKPPIPSAPPS